MSDVQVPVGDASLTRDLVYRFCSRLKLSEKRQAGAMIGIGRLPGNVSELDRDKAFLIAARDAGKLDDLARYINRLLGDRPAEENIVQLSASECLLSDMHDALHRGEVCPECGHNPYTPRPIDADPNAHDARVGDAVVSILAALMVADAGDAERRAVADIVTAFADARVAVERERCARIAETFPLAEDHPDAGVLGCRDMEMAAAIRDTTGVKQ